jgi:hypothetical protein
MRQEPRLSRSYEEPGYRQVDEYIVSLAIDAGALPRNYDIQLRFVAPDKRPVTREIEFYVGARDQAAFIDAAAATTSIPTITAGTESPLSLTILNKFPTYRVAVRRIEVLSEPDGLIEPFRQERSEEIPALGAKRIEVSLRAKGSWRQMFWPIEATPRLRVLLVYDDGYRTGMERLPHIPIDFKLDVSLTIVAVLTAASLIAGALAGTWLRMKYTTVSARERTRAWWERVLASVILAGFIVGLALLAKVEIVADAASLRVPLHRPSAVLLIAFVVALYDPSDWVRTVRSKFKPAAD